MDCHVDRELALRISDIYRACSNGIPSEEVSAAIRSTLDDLCTDSKRGLPSSLNNITQRRLNIIGYARKSNESSTGNSILEQENMIRAYFPPDGSRRGFVLSSRTPFFSDIVSGINCNRAGLDQALLELLSDDSCDGLAVLNMDRLSRSLTFGNQILDRITKAQKHLIVVKDDLFFGPTIDKNEERNNLQLLLMKLVFAQIEHTISVKRSEDHLESRIKNNCCLGLNAGFGTHYRHVRSYEVQPKMNAFQESGPKIAGNDIVVEECDSESLQALHAICHFVACRIRGEKKPAKVSAFDHISRLGIYRNHREIKDIAQQKKGFYGNLCSFVSQHYVNSNLCRLDLLQNKVLGFFSHGLLRHSADQMEEDTPLLSEDCHE
ncbi:hypothetical protein BJ741DRAFT_650751 [Chytriomyces cf. hyalinus JEL632]|nr:hypothetical protein BJ741DRAFT_650751 [Chytriomyces cf. hyalinus JEL632]